MNLLCGNVYRITDLYNDENNEITKVLVDQNGFVLDIKEALFIKELLENYLKNITEKEIIEINKETHNSLLEYRKTVLNDVVLRENFKKNGYVYVIKKIDENIVKIGMSKNYNERTKQISTKLHFEVETIKVFKTDDMESLEKHLHELYKDKRLNGEWFKLTDSDIKHIKYGVGLTYGKRF